MASELRKAVVAQPVRLVALASELSAIDGEYFTALVEGLTETVRAEVTGVNPGVVLAPLLDLIALEPRPRSDVLRAAVRLVEAMTAKDHPMLASLAPQLGRIVELGVADEDPVATDSADRSGRDDVTDGVDRARGVRWRPRSISRCTCQLQVAFGRDSRSCGRAETSRRDRVEG